MPVPLSTKLASLPPHKYAESLNALLKPNKGRTLREALDSFLDLTELTWCCTQAVPIDTLLPILATGLAMAAAEIETTDRRRALLREVAGDVLARRPFAAKIRSELEGVNGSDRPGEVSLLLAAAGLVSAMTLRDEITDLQISHAADAIASVMGKNLRNWLRATLRTAALTGGVE